MTDGNLLRDRAAIVGFGHTKYGKRGEHAERGYASLVVEAVQKACDDAGISPAEIDGYASYSGDPTDAGCWHPGSGPNGSVSRAWVGAAVAGPWAAPTCTPPWQSPPARPNYVAVTRGIIQSPLARFGGTGRAVPKFPGLQTPGQSFALAARRHMHHVRHQGRALRRGRHQRAAERRKQS